MSPIDRDGRVRDEVLARLCEHLIAAGVHGLTPLGSTGEFAYLGWAQRRRVVEVTLEAAAGRVPVVAGVAATTTAEAVAPGARARARWAAPASSRSSRPTSRCPRTAWSPISRRSRRRSTCPVVLYTNPQFQRSRPVARRDRAPRRGPNIRYLKDASTNTGRLLSIMSRVDDRLGIFSASAHIPACVMLLGGKGWMAGPACLIPRQSVRLYELCRAGRWAEAMALQRALWRLNQLFAKYALAACIKGGLELQGFPVGDPLPPQPALDDTGRVELRAVAGSAR